MRVKVTYTCLEQTSIININKQITETMQYNTYMGRENITPELLTKFNISHKGQAHVLQVTRQTYTWKRFNMVFMDSDVFVVTLESEMPHCQR